MQNVQGTRRTCEPSYITLRFLICMTVPLRFNVDLILEQGSTRVKNRKQGIPKTYDLDNLSCKKALVMIFGGLW